MVANMTADQLNTWNYDFLRSLGVSNYGTQARDLGFLGAWENRENVGNFAQFNPLATTMSGYGGHTITQPGAAHDVGVKWFPSIEQGASANAAALMGNTPGYAELLNAFRTGTLDQSASYQGLHSWSAGPNAPANQGYWSLTGIGSTPGSGQGGGPAPPPGGEADKAAAAAAAAEKIQLQRQVDLQGQLAAIDEEFARREAGFQSQLLRLSQQGLGIQEGALDRAMKEAPLLQEDINKIYQLQYGGIKQSEADVNRAYKQNLVDQMASTAGSGSGFTKGTRDERANIIADHASSIASLERSKATLQAQQNQEAISYLEKIAAYQDQKKQYDIISQRYGIQGQEIMQRLASTLQQTKIGAGMNVADLMTQMAQTDLSLVSSVPAPLITPGLTQNPYTGDPTTAGQLPAGPNWNAYTPMG